MEKPLRYPDSMMDDKTDYLSIKILKYVASGFGSGESIVRNKGSKFKVNDDKSAIEIAGGETYTNTAENRAKYLESNTNTRTVNRRTKGTSPLGTIFLPIPPNIQDGNSVTFGAGELDGLTASTLGIIKDAFDRSKGADLKDLPKVISAFAGDASRLALSPEAQKYFIDNIAASAANIPFGGNLTASQLLTRTTGQILNPNMELLFKGVNLRSFKFSFKMTPRSENEAIQIKKIIRKLKKEMSPSGESTTYLETPRVFQLEYRQGNRPHPFLHKFKECALTDMSVNYTGEGTYATYGGKESAPVSMIMDLGFKELEPIYSSDYDTGSGTIGVGY